MIRPIAVFALEANIGAGKSTLLTAFGGRLPVCPHPVLLEPVDAWTASQESLSGGRSMLHAFYQDPATNAAAFQSFVINTRLAQLVSTCSPTPLSSYGTDDAPTMTAIISERSIWSARGVFGELTVPKTDPNWVAYDCWAEHAEWVAASVSGAYLAGIIYLRTSPAVCLTRIDRRGRPAETAADPTQQTSPDDTTRGGISLAYLERLHARHEEWVGMQGCPVLVLDGDLDCGIDGDEAALDRHIWAIRKFVDTHIDEYA